MEVYTGAHSRCIRSILVAIFPQYWAKCLRNIISGVAKTFPGGRLAHTEGQNEEENKLSLRKHQENWSKCAEKMRKVELFPTRDCEAGYGPEYYHIRNDETFIVLIGNILFNRLLVKMIL